MGREKVAKGKKKENYRKKKIVIMRITRENIETRRIGVLSVIEMRGSLRPAKIPSLIEKIEPQSE